MQIQQMLLIFKNQNHDLKSREDNFILLLPSYFCICKCTKPDVLMITTFSCTRVQYTYEDDNHKLEHIHGLSMRKN